MSSAWIVSASRTSASWQRSAVAPLAASASARAVIRSSAQNRLTAVGREVARYPAWRFTASSHAPVPAWTAFAAPSATP
jgi:hypothetical protein